MTSPSASGGTTPTFSRETLPARAVDAQSGRPPAASAQRPFALTFAAYLDLLAREARAGRTLPPGDGLVGRTGVPPRTSSSPSDGADTTPPPQDLRAGADEEGDGVVSALDAVAVGRDAPIDPMFPIMGSLAPRGASPLATVESPSSSTAPDVRPPMEQLMSKLVRRIAWSGNARTGSARLELGAGELEGATLTIHADDGVVRVALDLPPGVDGDAWKERILGRLGARGLQVEAVEVG